MEKGGLIDLKQVRTTIWVRKGTKKNLDELGERRDTYDDIIERLIKENESLRQSIGNARITAKNRINVSRAETRKSALYLGSKLPFEFRYIVPINPTDADYRFGIALTKGQKRDLLQYAKHPAELYLRMIEKIVQMHISNLFQIDEKHLFDLDWWKRKFKNMGLSEETYRHDIEEELIKRGIVP